MHRDVYEWLASVLSRLPASAWPHYNLLAKRFGVSVEAITSIYSQTAHLYVMRAHKAFENDSPVYATRYTEGKEMLELCDIADMPPCMFLRRVLEQPPWSCNKQAVKRIFKDPDVAAQLINTSDIDELALVRLTADIKQCLECDQVYSPAADAKRHDIGVEHESKLERCLSLAKLAYDTEEHLRTQGAYKTPDALLQVPFAVDGRIVNWIDSKATFGDDHVHREQTRKQYSTYINRYGPGMVIYWFGFIDDLQHSTADLVLADTFPSCQQIVQLPCLPVPAELLLSKFVVDGCRSRLDSNSDCEDICVS